MSEVDKNTSLTGFRRIGATPALIRTAWDFAKKGLGVHYINDFYYDNVEVSEVYSWKTLGGSSQGCLRVSFRKGSSTLRYIELSVGVSGAGGTSIVKEVAT